MEHPCVDSNLTAIASQARSAFHCKRSVPDDSEDGKAKGHTHRSSQSLAADHTEQRIRRKQRSTHKVLLHPSKFAKKVWTSSRRQMSRPRASRAIAVLLQPRPDLIRHMRLHPDGRGGNLSGCIKDGPEWIIGGPGTV